MNNTNENRRIGLFIDCENVSANYIKEIFEELAKYGEINVRQAYGNWKDKRIEKWEEQLQEYAITPIQEFSNIKGKNAVDISIVIDVMKLICTKKVDMVCLVTSDSDFTKLVKEVKAEGVGIIGFGEEKTPKALIKAYGSDFFCLGLNNKKSLENDSIKLLKKAITKKKGDDDFALVSQLGSYINQMGENSKKYGYETWGEAIKDFPKYFEVDYIGNRKDTMRVRVL